MHFNAKFITLDDPLTDPNSLMSSHPWKEQFCRHIQGQTGSPWINWICFYSCIIACIHTYTWGLQTFVHGPNCSKLRATVSDISSPSPLQSAQRKRKREKKWPLKDLNTKRNQLSRPSWVSPDILIISLFKSCRLLPCLSVWYVPT